MIDFSYKSLQLGVPKKRIQSYIEDLLPLIEENPENDEDADDVEEVTFLFLKRSFKVYFSNPVVIFSTTTVGNWPVAMHGYTVYGL